MPVTVYAVPVDCIRSVFWLHSKYLLVMSVSKVYSNIYEPLLISCIPLSCFSLVWMMSISVLKLLPNIFFEYIFDSYYTVKDRLWGKWQVYCSPKHKLFPVAKRREIVYVEGDNKLATSQNNRFLTLSLCFSNWRTTIKDFFFSVI